MRRYPLQRGLSVDPAESARQVLQLLGVDEPMRKDIARRLHGHAVKSPRLACELEVAALISKAARLGADGWTVASLAPSQVAAVYAVAALGTVESARTSASKLTAHELLAEALFIVGREDMRRATLDSEKRARRERGLAGGRPPRVPDEVIRAEWERCLQRYNGRSWGCGKQVAARLKLDEKTLSARLKKLGLR